LRSQKFGIEIEMTGLTRETAAGAIAEYFGTTASFVGGFYNAYSVRNRANGEWKVMSDASIRCESRRHTDAGGKYSVEVVSPVCSYDDIEDVQKIVRALKRAGAIVNDSCGIHVHVDAAPHTPRTLKNLVNVIAAKEELLYKALRVHVSRERYCGRINERFLSDLNRCRPETMDGMTQIWYRGRNGSNIHYEDSRYHGLNLHSVFYRGTIEFRLFNSTLHAGEVKSFIQLCLAISHQALIQQRASHARTRSENEKYTFRTWLLRLGLIGDEFKSARLHLLKNLEGNIAWKDPEQAEKQKARLLDNRQREERAALAGTDMEDQCDPPDDAVRMESSPDSPAISVMSSTEYCLDADEYEEEINVSMSM
jgi:hypothetical protein